MISREYMERFHPEFVKKFDLILGEVANYNSQFRPKTKRKSGTKPRPVYRTTIQRRIMEYLISEGEQSIKNIVINIDAPYATITYNLRVLQQKGYVGQTSRYAPYYSKVDQYNGR